MAASLSAEEEAVLTVGMPCISCDGYHSMDQCCCHSKARRLVSVSRETVRLFDCASGACSYHRELDLTIFSAGLDGREDWAFYSMESEQQSTWRNLKLGTNDPAGKTLCPGITTASARHLFRCPPFVSDAKEAAHSAYTAFNDGTLATIFPVFYKLISDEFEDMPGADEQARQAMVHRICTALGVPAYMGQYVCVRSQFCSLQTEASSDSTAGRICQACSTLQRSRTFQDRARRKRRFMEACNSPRGASLATGDHSNTRYATAAEMRIHMDLNSRETKALAQVRYEA